MGLNGFLITFSDGRGPRSITDRDHGCRSGLLPRLGFHRKAAVQPARPVAGQKRVREAREGRGRLMG